MFVNHVIYLDNNKTYIGNNIKNSATCFGSVKSSSGQIQVPVLYFVFGLMMVQMNRNMSPNFLILLPL